MKPKLICQTCYNHGETKTVCEILPSGFVSIERRHSKDAYADHTVVNGTDFIIVCGNCGNTILKRERRDDDSFIEKITIKGTISEQAGTLMSMREQVLGFGSAAQR